jgi:surface carbohydrate biosynthesis protein
MRKFAYIPVESKVRELDSKLLVSLEAVARGYVVVLGSKRILSALDRLPCGVLIYKDASAAMEDRFRIAKDAGHKVVVHDEEGLVQQSWQDYLNRRIRFNSINYVDLFLCWGKEQFDAVSNFLCGDKKSTAISRVGHPRVDLLRDGIRSYNFEGARSPKKLILINTKLAEANHRLGPDGWLNILRSHQMIRNESELELRYQQIAYKKKLLEHYERLIGAVSLSFPDAEIVIRPHPSEDEETWKRLTAESNNVIVTNAMPIGYWLHRSDVVIHTGCTTAIEAFLMGKPVISYKPISDERFEIRLPDSISMSARSDAECSGLIEAALSDQFGCAELKDKGLAILQNNIDSIDGEYSFTKIVDQLDALEVPLHRFGIADELRLRSIFGKDYLRSVFLGGPYADNKCFGYAEIVKTLQRLRDVLGYSVNVSVSKLGDNLYMLK